MTALDLFPTVDEQAERNIAAVRIRVVAWQPLPAPWVAP